MTDGKWQAMQDSLRNSVGDSNYRNWIQPLAFQGYDKGVVCLSAPNKFFCKHVSQNYGDVIMSHLTRADGRVMRLTIDVAANFPDQPTPAVAKAPAAPTDDIDAISTPLDSRLVFDNFVVGKPNEMAHAAARRVAEGDATGFNPLFLYSGVGLGKTHLMHAIAWELRARRPDLRVIYMTAEQFTYKFIRALRDKTMVDFKGMFRSVDVLLIDDVQFIAGKDSTQEEFFHTFNALVEQNKQIVLSSDRAPSEIRDLENRIRSRLQSGLMIDLHPADYELRLSILQAKAEDYMAQNPGVVVDDGILEFLAQRISSNVRTLEGALTRLFAFATLVKQPITMELARDCLADVLRQTQARVTVEEIQRRVAEHYNIRLSDLIGPKRTRIFVRPRQMAMYLCKTLTARSLPEIGRHFGKRDHTTVIHAIRKIEELTIHDAGIAQDLEILRRILEEA